MVPMILPSAIMGRPPSSGDAPRTASVRKPMPPCATRSSNTLVCRLKSSALRALSWATAIRAVLRVIEPMQHHDIASAVEDDDGHAPVVLYGFDLGRGHYFLGGLNPDRRPIGRRRRRGWRLL